VLYLIKKPCFLGEKKARLAVNKGNVVLIPLKK
jgi:hypothetical protein